MSDLRKLLNDRSNISFLISQLGNIQVEGVELSKQLDSTEAKINSEVNRLCKLEKENKSLKGQIEYYKQMLDSYERSMDNSYCNPNGRWGY